VIPDPSTPDQSRLYATLREVFGFSAFRPNQLEIVQALLEGRDAFVVMPTGGGKSLCYQLPARLLDGTCLVVSPLISLMKDQVDAAVENGLSAAFLNSSLKAAARRDVIERLRGGELDLLYVSPERFALDGFTDLLKACRLSFVAIDEAHCISEWGHDFRPDYLALGALTETFPGVPVAAFTATATLKVQDDIVRRLQLRDPLVVRASFNRPNLFYAVHAEDGPAAADPAVRAGPPGPGRHRLPHHAQERGGDGRVPPSAHRIRALPYHAGLDDEVRAANQEAFNRDQVEVIVATIAFGMGIDKSNVRYVLHGDLPKNIEGYYQETGRSGRDGDPAHCLLLFGYGDMPRNCATSSTGPRTRRSASARCAACRTW
jgi:ATP-dependent DNA helicase RecQ